MIRRRSATMQPRPTTKIVIGLVGLVVSLIAVFVIGCGRGPVEFDRPSDLEPYGAWIAAQGADDLLSATGRAEMRRLHDLGYRWIAYGPTATMSDITRPQIDYGTDDDRDRAVIRTLRAIGFDVFLLPRIESPSFFTGRDAKWRGDIVMPDAARRGRFHDNLRNMTVHFARMAEEEGCRLFGCGLEYVKTTTVHPAEWREIIAAVRVVYSGAVTYSANWWGEFDRITFWDDLDFIGIGAYFPVARKRRADVETMVSGWDKAFEKIEDIVARYRKPVIFSEIGYPTFADAGWKPWQWTDRREKIVDEQHQADCYRALFRRYKNIDWLAGMFIWRYPSDPRSLETWDYCPRNKPAERVIQKMLQKIPKKGP